MSVSITESVIAGAGVTTNDRVGLADSVTDVTDDIGNPTFSFMLGSMPGNATLTRNSNAYVVDDTAVYIETSVDVARFAYNYETQDAEGILIESTCVNLITTNHRDLTAAAWVAVDISPTNIRGIDGVLLSSSRLEVTATAGGTILRDVSGFTVGNEYTLSAFVYGELVTDRVDLTYDNGSTEVQTEITGDIYLSDVHQRVFTTFTATTTQYSVGFRALGLGDFIRVDCVQIEEGGFATSPIIDAGVTRKPEVLIFTINGKTWTFGWPEASQIFEATKLQTVQFVRTGVADTYDAYITFLFEATQTTITHVIEDVEFT